MFSWAHLSDITLLCYYRLYTHIKAEPFGDKRFPNVGEKLEALEEVLMKRIPAKHLWEIEKMLTDKKIKVQ